MVFFFSFSKLYLKNLLNRILRSKFKGLFFFRRLCPLPGNSGLFTVQLELVFLIERELEMHFLFLWLVHVCTRYNTVQKGGYIRNIGYIGFPIS